MLLLLMTALVTGKLTTDCVDGIIVQPRSLKSKMSFDKCAEAARVGGVSFVHGNGNYCYMYNKELDVHDYSPTGTGGYWKTCTTSGTLCEPMAVGSCDMDWRRTDYEFKSGKNSAEQCAKEFCTVATLKRGAGCCQLGGMHYTNQGAEQYRASWCFFYPGVGSTEAAADDRQEVALCNPKSSESEEAIYMQQTHTTSTAQYVVNGFALFGFAAVFYGAVRFYIK